jgi:lipoprotein-anchoring transpeptidase ErfK/SrfK
VSTLAAAALSALATALWAPGAAAAAVGCSDGPATKAVVGHPTDEVAWRAGLEGRTAVYARGASRRPQAWLDFSEAPWLLVIGAEPMSGGRCLVEVRLPSRPNGAAGWVNSQDVLLRPTAWRIDVSLSRRTLTLMRSGRRVQTARVVIGKPSTPTPSGLFAIVDAMPGNPADFLGSWVLTLTAHSDVLRQFDGGDGTVAIHGRGGASLVDPLGTAMSHGCIRLANDSVDALVGRVGRYQVPGTPVQIS